MSYLNHKLIARSDYEKRVLQATLLSMAKEGRIRVGMHSIDVSNSTLSFTENGEAFLVSGDAILIGPPHLQLYTQLANSLTSYRNGSNKGLVVELVENLSLVFPDKS